MVAGSIAERMARSGATEAKQYAGLALFVGAESLFFAPLLWFVSMYAGSAVIPSAAITTITLFGGLSGFVLLSKKDFSFLRGALTIASFAALAFILCSIFFGLGGLYYYFSLGMIVLMCGYILYYTSQIVHHYRTDQHVAASLALFSTIATLFWYVIQLFLHSDD